MILTKDKQTYVCENVSRDENGELMLAGVPLSGIAKKYGTPLYLYDEERIRYMCQTYMNAIEESFGKGGARVLYASKAASFKRLYEIIAEEGLGIDVVSKGEIFSAIKAGFPLENAYFHSNNKTDSDIEYAIDAGVGYFVADNKEELISIDKIAKKHGIKQKVLLRITPGIDPHTYAAVNTGKVDSKFGSAIETGLATDITKLALSLDGIKLSGFHCHVGSQIFDENVYLAASDVMLGFTKTVYDLFGYEPELLDIGGGLGVRYVMEQPEINIGETIIKVAKYIKDKANELEIKLPIICFEPGRSIVADSGMTLYTVGSVKNIKGYKTYVSTDGGMTDNPRYALYGSPYTILPVFESSSPDRICSVVGRCCESGDILQENVPLPEDLKRGDLIACLTTGAYHFSMSSNYNKLLRPPVVMINDGEDYLAVKGQSLEDLCALEI